MTRVKEVESLEAFKKELKDAGSNLVVVDFTATWCGPCKQISPVFESLSGLPENKNVVFLKVDVDEAEDICQAFEVRSMPTFIFFKNEAQVHRFSGNDQGQLKEKVQQLRT
ncbi:thioredoxin isoform X1 [Plectropomus leopardus]|uniref:thioredoxin isoform X1 n=1 Tax=Plectropomus leopardus TaxID=160734 RepID=UPI001C4CA62B|nr:thioredoxin isoform X1 [Plectropomus leopardus]